MINFIHQYVDKYLPLSEIEISTLLPYLEKRQFPKKTLLVKSGEIDTYLNLVVKGVAIKYFTKDSEMVVTQIAPEGDLICSSVSFLSRKASIYEIKALEPTTVLSITKTNLDELLSSDQNWEKLGRLVMIELLLQKETWGYNRVANDTSTRFLNFIKNNPEIILRVPQKIIASYLNIKQETFSRMKHLLKNNT